MDHRRAPFLPLAGVAVATLLVVAACSAAAAPTATPAPSAAAVVPPSTAPAASPAAPVTGAAPTVTVATSATLGKYLAGRDGLALYVFKKDSGSTSACYDGCATAWPPFVVGAGQSAAAGTGVTGTLGTTTRTDGSIQVTYDGAPLYYFGGDKAAGDTNGQGLNGVWFVATPSGSSSVPKGSGGGYQYTP